jgi:hypothetical protein
MLFLAPSLAIFSLSLAIAFAALDTLAGFAAAALANFFAGVAALDAFGFCAGLGFADFFAVAICIDLLLLTETSCRRWRLSQS